MSDAERPKPSRIPLLLAAALLIALAWPWFRGEVYAYSDMGALHLPTRTFYARCLAQGDRFDWFPNLYCGFYLQGEGQAGMYHPLHWVLYRWLPITSAFHLDLLIPYAAMAVGTGFFLRRWGLDRDSAGLGGLIFTFGGFNAVHFMHMNMIAVVAHLPWLLGAIDALLRSQEPRQRTLAGVAVAALTTSEVLMGHPQFVWYSGLVEAAYAVWIVAPQRAWRWLLILVGWKILGLVGGAVQILPTHDLMLESDRAKATPAMLAMGSLPPANLVQTIAPYLYRSRVVAPVAYVLGQLTAPAEGMRDWRAHEFGFYNGAVVPILLMWAGIRRRKLPRNSRRLALAAATLAAVGLILAFGEYTPLFAVVSRLPGFNLFRVPARYVLFYDLGTAAIAAVGFAELVQGDRASWREVRPIWLLPLAAAGVAIGAKTLARPFPNLLMRPFFAPNSLILAGVALSCVAALLVTLAARKVRFAPTLLCVFAALDLGSYALTFMHQEPTYDVRTAASASLPTPEVPTLRLRSRGFDDRVTTSGARLVDGFSTFTPISDLDFANINALRVASVGWVDVGTTSNNWQPIPNPMPRARLVSDVVVSQNPGRDIDKINIATTALLDHKIPLDSTSPGRAQILHDRPGNIAIQTTCLGRQLLILSERFHPGWRATRDGALILPLQAYGDFLACPVPPGTHEITLEFRPNSLRYGLILSLLGVTAMLAATLGVVWLPPQSHVGSLPAPPTGSEQS